MRSNYSLKNFGGAQGCRIEGYKTSDSLERVVWLAVIAKAIEDCIYHRLPVGYFSSRDFEEVCEMAHILPEEVRRANLFNLAPR